MMSERSSFSIHNKKNSSVMLNIFTFFSFMSLGFLSLNLFSPIVGSNAKDNLVTKLGADVNEVASITLSTDNLTFNITPTSSGVFASDSIVATVDTNSLGGYELYFSTSDASSSIENLDPNISATITSDFNDTVTSSTMPANTWGYSLDNTNYNKVPISSNVATIRSIDHYPETAEKTNTVYIGTKISNSLPSGTYSKDITFSILAHATPAVPTYTITWDMNGGEKNEDATYPATMDKTRTIDLTNLTPERENYTFAGWSNGTTTFEGTETEANINPNNLDSITMTAQWESIVREWEFDYTGNVQTFTAPDTGYYKLEVWGAQGGKGSNVSYSSDGFDNGGPGGYSVGTISLTRDLNLYVYVGQKGQTTQQSGVTVTSSWNGGGSYAPNLCCGARNKAQGGGATDISLLGTANSTDWDDNNHFYSRIIVAGGGGGTGDTAYVSGYNSTGDNRTEVGGSGGGYQGGDGQNYNNDSFNQSNSRAGRGGSQTSGGIAPLDLGWSNNSSQLAGSFGKGGFPGSSSQCSSGGGGGWYGGSGSTCDAGAGGGSGYIYNSASESNYPSGKLVNSNYYLLNGRMYQYEYGSSTLQKCYPSTAAGTYTVCITNTGAHISEYANTGNGYAKITYLGTSI